MAKFRVTVPLYKTITGKISHVVEAQSIKRANEIFTQTVENCEFHLHDWVFVVYKKNYDQNHNLINFQVVNFQDLGRSYDEIHDEIYNEIYDEIYDYIIIEEIK